jgi:hypothetical protein
MYNEKEKYKNKIKMYNKMIQNNFLIYIVMFKNDGVHIPQLEIYFRAITRLTASETCGNNKEGYH